LGALKGSGDKANAKLEKNPHVQTLDKNPFDGWISDDRDLSVRILDLPDTIEPSEQFG
jgi:hypothetical protein